MSGELLYVSFDGVLQPLGFSQVVRVIAGIARRGPRYHLVSLERAKDLKNQSNSDRVRGTLTAANIRWTPICVDLVGSAVRSAEAFGRMMAATLRLVRQLDVALIHARGYQSALVAHAVRGVTGTPYLFDARGCWIEERQDWFASPATYAAGKLLERRLYRDARAVVTLTALHAGDAIDGAFGRKEATLVATIPTCADYDAFQLSSVRPEKPSESSVIPVQIQDRLRGKNVIAIIGSLNRSYAVDSGIRLASHACSASERVHILVITQQTEAYADALRRAGVAGDRFSVVQVAHQDMPTWLHWIDWGLLLLPDVAAKRGSMPTKLAEFFAAGVRPIAYGCNGEMTSWVRRAGSGLVLDDIGEDTLEAAGRTVATSHPSLEALINARTVTAPHFSLAAGVERYAGLLRRLTNS